MCIRDSLKRIDDFLQRLDLPRDGNRLRIVTLNRQFKRFVDCIAHGSQLIARRRRERQLALAEFLHAAEDVLRIRCV